MAHNFSLKKAFQAAKNYFDLGHNPAADDAGDYNYAVTAKPAARASFGKSVLNYFDLASEYRAADKLAQDIMALANRNNVAQGRFDSSTMTMKMGYSFTESEADGTAKFAVQLNRDGLVRIKCDADFAEKVKALPTVATVTQIKAPAAPKAKPPQP